MAFISGSVGNDGRNVFTDVRLIQNLLARHIDSPNRMLRVDGDCGPETLEAIETFQQGFMEQSSGLIEPLSETVIRLWPPEFVNPTGKTLRHQDRYGSGHFAAVDDRGLRQGCDYLAMPGQIVKATLEGIVVEVFRPYQDGADRGVLQGLIVEASDGTRCHLWHLTPIPGILGKLVRASDTVGHARTLQNRYPAIMDHVHVRIVSRTGALLNPSNFIR